MNDYQKIIRSYESEEYSKSKLALATLVKLYGSSYRRPGARMLMNEEGKWSGAISGGCLEGDALRKARKIMQENRPQLIRYDTMEDNDALNLGVGLGCNGIIDVLIEVVDQSAENSIHWLKKAQTYQATSVLATVYRTEEDSSHTHIGEKCILYPDSQFKSNIAIPGLEDSLLEDMRALAVKQYDENKTYSTALGQVEVFLEAIRPSTQLIIFGAGFDAVPLMKLAKTIGWQVVITDDCPAHILPVRFSEADQLMAIDRNQVAEKLEFFPHSACVLMSHNYKYDLQILKQLMGSKAGYIGMLGPRKKFERMLKEVSEEGIHWDESMVKKIHNPIGLDLGAETPEEIALSIVSEIQAKMNHKKAPYLKDKEGYIHDR